MGGENVASSGEISPLGPENGRASGADKNGSDRHMAKITGSLTGKLDK